MLERYVGIKVAAEFLGVKPSTIYVWKHKGIIPHYKIGGTKSLRFKLSELDKFAGANNGQQETSTNSMEIRPAIRGYDDQCKTAAITAAENTAKTQ